MQKLLFLKTDGSAHPPLIFLAVMLLVTSLASAQVTSPNNVPSGSITNYLGWNSTVTDDVEITNNSLQQPIIFSTDNTERMRIDGSGKTIFGLKSLFLSLL